MRALMSSSRPITLLSCAMSAGIPMREKARTARDVARARGTRSQSRGLSARQKVTRIWVYSTEMERFESRRGGKQGTYFWLARGRALCSRPSTCSCCGGCSGSACCGPRSVQTATLTPRYTSRSVSHLCPCQGRTPACRPCSRLHYVFIIIALVIIGTYIPTNTNPAFIT